MHSGHPADTFYSIYYITLHHAQNYTIQIIEKTQKYGELGPVHEFVNKSNLADIQIRILGLFDLLCSKKSTCDTTG